MHVHELYLHRTANKLFIGTFEKGVYIYDLNIQKIVRPEVELTDVNIAHVLSSLNTKELLVATEGAGVHKLKYIPMKPNLISLQIMVVTTKWTGTLSMMYM